MTKTNFSLLLLGFLALSSCTKSDDLSREVYCTKNDENYEDDQGRTLNLSSQKWHLNKNELGGVDVGVTIRGFIVGDSAKIRTYGDGLLSDVIIVLDKDKKFNQDVGIFFTSSAIDEESIYASTLMMVFSEQDTLKVEINSCSIPTSVAII